MPTVIVNGKKVNVPDSATSEDIIRATGKRNVNPNTRAVVRNTNAAVRDKLKPGMKYRVREGEKFTTVPDRVKASFFDDLRNFFRSSPQSNNSSTQNTQHVQQYGGETVTYFGNKENWRKQVIESQVLDVSEKMFKSSPVELDDDCNYVVFNSFLLPPEWQRANSGLKSVKMMLIFPDQYPDLPTNGFYLPANLQIPENARHFYTRGYGGAFGETDEEIEFMRRGNWKWYCTHILPGAWQPAHLRVVDDWRKGDNLWDILTICKDVLTHPLED